jgi:hypothetical protein
MSFRPRRLAPLLAVALAVTAYGVSSAPKPTPAGYVAGNQGYVEFQPATGLFTIQPPGRQNSTDPGRITSVAPGSIGTETGAAASTRNEGGHPYTDLDPIQIGATGSPPGTPSAATPPVGSVPLVSYRMDAAPDQ